MRYAAVEATRFPRRRGPRSTLPRSWVLAHRTEQTTLLLLLLLFFSFKHNIVDVSLAENLGVPPLFFLGERGMQVNSLENVEYNYVAQLICSWVWITEQVFHTWNVCFVHITWIQGQRNVRIIHVEENVFWNECYFWFDKSTTNYCSEISIRHLNYQSIC